MKYFYAILMFVIGLSQFLLVLSIAGSNGNAHIALISALSGLSMGLGMYGVYLFINEHF